MSHAEVAIPDVYILDPQSAIEVPTTEITREATVLFRQAVDWVRTGARSAVFALALPFIAAAGSGCDGVASQMQNSGDMGDDTIAQTFDGPPLDHEEDSEPDASVDASVDAGIDEGVDASVDEGVDAGGEGEAEAEAEAEVFETFECTPPDVATIPQPILNNTAAEHGLDAHQTLYPVSAAVTGGLAGPGGPCVFDKNGDGFSDLFYPTPTSIASSSNVFYLNDGFGDFTQLTPHGATGPVYPTGCLPGDLDNDGDDDLLVLGAGDFRVYQNPGGTSPFVDVTDAWGFDIRSGKAWSATSADFDGNGYLDLVIARYVSDGMFGVPIPPLLYMGYGENFVEDSVARGFTYGPPTGLAFAIIAADIDRDLDVDIYVGVDGGRTMQNRFFNNDGTGMFTEGAADLGLAWATTDLAPGESPDSADDMSLHVLSMDGDTIPDVLSANYACRTNLYLQCGTNSLGEIGGCTNVSISHGLTNIEATRWGGVAADFNNDGAIDLLFGTAETVPADPCAFSLPAVTSPELLWGVGEGYFEESTDTAGDTDMVQELFGCGHIDVDMDGILEIACSAFNTHPGTDTASDYPVLFESEESLVGNFMYVNPVIAEYGERQDVGAWVTVTPEGGCPISQPVVLGGEFGGGVSAPLHFGLGEALSATVEIDWTDGTSTTVTTCPINDTCTLVR